MPRCRAQLSGIFFAAALATAAPGADSIVPEPLPDLHIPGFHFPESEATLTGWITTMTRELPGAPAATAKIQRHGWAL